MDKAIGKLEAWTKQVIERLDWIEYEEMTRLIDERQMLINELRLDAMTQEQKKQYRTRIESLLQQDPPILRKLEELKTEASGGIQKINAGRVQKSGYDAQYNLDGIFFDQRK